MRNIKETFMRLMIICEHFSNGKLYEDYSWYPDFLKNDEPVIVIGKRTSYYDLFPFVLTESTYLFTEFEKAERGIIIYRPKPILGEVEGLRHFLGLSKKEFSHLFVPTLQSVDFGGKELCVDAKLEQVAKNLEIFLGMQLNSLALSKKSAQIQKNN